MRLTRVELRRVRLPLAAPFRSSLGQEWEREVLLVKVAGPDSEGWGECAALARPSYTSEYVDGAHLVLHRHLVPRVLSLSDVKAEGVYPALAAVRGHLMAKAAVEMAVLDAELRAQGTPLARHLGAVRDVVDAGVAVGITDSVGELLEAVDGFVREGYGRVKLKIAPGWDVEPVRAVRERFGDDLALLVDANGAYSPADADHLAGLDPFGLLLLEQPFAEDALLAHAQLAGRMRTPICLDESITSLATASDAIALGATSVVNLKPGRVGGLLAAREIHDLCAAAGVPVWCGGMLETGLGRAANVALAALPNFTLPGDLSASDRYYHHDLTAPFRLEAGKLRVPDGPGLGVEPLPEVLQACTVSVEEVVPAS